MDIHLIIHSPAKKINPNQYFFSVISGLWIELIDRYLCGFFKAVSSCAALGSVKCRFFSLSAEGRACSAAVLRQLLGLAVTGL